MRYSRNSCLSSNSQPAALAVALPRRGRVFVAAHPSFWSSTRQMAAKHLQVFNPDATFDAGLSRAAFHVACQLIFEELSAGRGVSVPDLGTFTIDNREKWMGTGKGTVVTRTPMLVLSANFENIGVKLPAAVPQKPPPSHMVGWQLVAQRCGADRDLVRRAVATTLSSFANEVASCASSTTRSSSATLDLGPCGKLRIVRCGEMRAGCEPRFVFSESLINAVRRGPAAEAAQAQAAAKAAAKAAEDWVIVSAPDDDIDLVDEPVDLSDGATKTSSADPSFVTLARLRYTPEWANNDAAAPAPSQPRASTTFGLPRASRRPLSDSAEKIMASAAASAAAASAALAGSALREPLEILPMVGADVDEWAMRKLQSSRFDRPGEGGRRVLSVEERRRKAENDLANLHFVRQRASTGMPLKTTRAEARGVNKILRKLGPPLQATIPLGIPTRPVAAARVADLEGGEEDGAAETAAALLQRKMELEARLRHLERQLDEVSIPSTRSKLSRR